MKKIIAFTIGIFLFSGCNSQPTTPEEDFGENLDLSNLFAQVCQTKDGPCVIMPCNLTQSEYICAEKISDQEKNCSSQKSKDEVMGQYTICGFESTEESEKYSIFNYSKSLELLQMGETPAELEQKIQEETQVVENGGTSSFLSTMLAVAGGSILGGMISNALFNSNSAMPPKQPASAYEQPLKKDDLDKAKTETKNNASKISDSVSKTQAKAKKTAEKNKSSSKTSSKSSPQKKSSSRKRR